MESGVTKIPDIDMKEASSQDDVNTTTNQQNQQQGEHPVQEETKVDEQITAQPPSVTWKSFKGIA
jgi:hypothetical protein